MNKVIMMGNLTRDPEVRYSQSAEPVAFAKYGIAISRIFKKAGEPEVDFFDCTVFGKQAEFAGKYFKKGMKVAISGRIQTRTWDDPQTGVKRYGTDILVEEQEFAESKASFESRAGNQSNNDYSGSQVPQQPKQQGGFAAISEPIEQDDLPF